MSEMQIHPNFKNLATFLVALFFVYLIYVLWGSGESKFPEIWVDLRDLINYSILAVEKGGLAVKIVHDEKRLFSETKGKTKEGRDEYVTKADLASNQLMVQTLQRFPGVKIISEEKSADLSESDLERYAKSNYDLWTASQDILKDIPSENVPLSTLGVWIDPLDATQEYTEDLLEYVTVMICVVVSGRPKFGVIYRPFQQQLVWGLVGHGVYPNSSALVKSPAGRKTIVVSRSHAGAVGALAKAAFGADFAVEPAGGAGFKSLRVLNGSADIYLHRTAIKKWDVCAADAILTAAGGRMMTLKGEDIDYFTNDPRVVNEDGLLAAMKQPYTYLSMIKSAMSVTAAALHD